MNTYWCAACQKEIPESEVRFVPAPMHKDCGSGRVTRVEEKKDA